MVKFLNFNFKNIDIETAMNSVNNYLIFGDKSEFTENLNEYDLDYALKELQENLIKANITYQISADGTIDACGKFRKIKIVLKKIIRKLCRWYLFDIIQQQTVFNAHAVRVLNTEQEIVKYLLAKNKSLQKNSVEMLSNFKLQYDLKLKEMMVHCDKERKQMESDHKLEIEQIKTNYDLEIMKMKTDYDFKIDQIEEKNDWETEKIKELYQVLRIESKEIRENKAKEWDKWYLDFENYFRGSREEIRRRNERYVDYYKDRKNILDLGCGRGEMLELLTEHQISCSGVDCNSYMVEICLSKGLDVTLKDCIEALEEREDSSIEGIFTSQMIEHLDLEKEKLLLELSYKKLKQDGILIIETVNPLILGIFCYGFYIDPTHTKPVHPAFLRYLAETAGFRVDPIQFTDEFPEEYKILISEDMPEEVKRIAVKINEQLYGAQDYYLVCRK